MRKPREGFDGNLPPADPRKTNENVVFPSTVGSGGLNADPHRIRFSLGFAAGVFFETEAPVNG